MLDLPKVDIAVVTAVHNGERYISDYIDSLSRQSINSFIVYIIDDGSNDASYILLSEKLKNSSLKYRLFKNTTNLGLTNSLNFLIEQVTETYVARLDVDDTWYPDFLEFQLNFLSDNTNIILSCTNMELYNTNSKVNKMDGNKCAEPFNACIYSGIVHLNDILIRNFIIHSTVFFRRSEVVELGGYNPKFKYAQDYDLWLKLLIKDCKIYYHDIVLGIRIADNLCIGNKKWVEQRLSVLKIKLSNFNHLFLNYRFFYGIFKDSVSVVLGFLKRML